MKKHIIILSGLGIILITIGLVMNFTIGLKLDKEQVKIRMNVINSTYELFKKDRENFSAIRDNLYDNIFSQLYFETLNQNINICLEELKNYEEKLDQVKLNAEKLKKDCENIYFPDTEVNTKCKTYEVSYEEMVNYFMNDIVQVNQNIEEYNKYQLENNTGNAPLQKYNTTKKYIDFNNDKKYTGKEEF